MRNVHGSNPKPLMSALGQKQTLEHVRVHWEWAAKCLLCAKSGHQQRRVLEPPQPYGSNQHQGGRGLGALTCLCRSTSNVLGCCRSEHGRSKLSARSALKPNLAQLGVVLAHAHVASFARPFETFLRQFPIVSGPRHRFVSSPRLRSGIWICDALEIGGIVMFLASV